MDTVGEKDLCVFWEWSYEYFINFRRMLPFHSPGGVAQNAGS